MRNFPAWLPKPNSWMSAILLILLMRGLSEVIKIIFQMSEPLLDLSPKLRILLYLATLVSPIIVIAVAHHILHIVLDRFFPNTRSPEMSQTPGIFPSLLSWWEGFFGWQTIALALLASSAYQIIISPQIYYGLNWWDEIKSFFTAVTFVQILTAAYLYHFEHFLRHHLMSIGSATRSNQL